MKFNIVTERRLIIDGDYEDTCTSCVPSTANADGQPLLIQIRGEKHELQLAFSELAKIYDFVNSELVRKNEQNKKGHYNGDH